MIHEESTFTLETETRFLALGTATIPGGNDVYASFTLSIQQRSIAIEGVAFNVGMESIGLTIRRFNPEKANVERFAPCADFPYGSTISDMGISAITYALKSNDGNNRRHRVPEMEPDKGDLADPNWFKLYGMWYLRADLQQEVTVHVCNRSKEEIKLSGVLLYRNILKP